MAEYATKDEVREIVSQAVEDLSQVIANFAQQVDGRFNKVEAEIVELKESHHKLLNTIDGFISRIDSYETEMKARDAQFERLVA